MNTACSRQTRSARGFRGLCCILVCLAALCLTAGVGHALPKTQDELKEIFDRLTKTGIKYGDIPSLYNPVTISVNDAANAFEANEQMLLVAFPNGIRMYPRSILVWHEVVNEYILGDPYCVTYSPLTGSFAAYATRVNDMNLVMDAEGRLYNNNSVLIDRNTGSLWLQLAGIAFDGPLSGKGLKQVPVMWTDWKHARKAFPKAQVVTRPRGTARQYGKDPYGDYNGKDTYYQNDVIYYQLTHTLDRRMSPKTQIIGIELDSLSFAVDIAYVQKTGFVNFFLGPYALLAVYDTTLGSVKIFKRDVWGGTALFKLVNNRLVDIESESVWNMDGVAVEGNLKGASLDPLFGVYAYWFAWASLYPETLTIPGPTMVPESALVKGKP